MHPQASPTPLRRLLVALPVAALAMAAAASPASAQDGGVRTTMDGVYTVEQAELGAKTYEAICARCHATGASLKGRGFLEKWSNQSLYRLWEYMSTRMPYGAPGSLSTEEYLGMLAWILQQNGYPAGDKPLPDTNLNGIFYEIGQINLVPNPDMK